MRGADNNTTSQKNPVALLIVTAGAALCGCIPALYILYRGFQAIGNTYAPNMTLITTLVINTLTLGVLAALVAGILGTVHAIIIERTDIAFPNLWRFLVCTPFVIPPYVSALCLLALLRPHGLLEKWLVAQGLASFGQLPFGAMFGVTGSSFVLGICLSPYVFFPVSATLRQGSGHFMEMAKQNGVHFWRRHLQITLPHLAPAMGGGMLLVLLYSLADFAVPALLRLPTFSTTIYSRFAGDVDRAGAALLSLPLMAITVVLLLIQDRMFGHGVIQIARSWAPQRVARLGRLAFSTYLFLGISILLSVGIPLGMLSYWLLSSVSPAEQASFVPIGQLAMITGKTVGFSVLMTSIIIVVAIVCARTMRHAGTLGYILSRTAQIGYALPGIVVALSVVLVSTRLLPVTLAGLVPLGIALFIRFVPQAIQGIDVAMLQITPTIEDAGRSMGQNVYQVLRYLIVPLSTPGIQTTWALVFLGILKELPATLILRPAGFDTLAVRVWMPTSDGFTAAAALPAMLMVVCALIPFSLIFRTQRKASLPEYSIE